MAPKELKNLLIFLNKVEKDARAAVAAKNVKDFSEANKIFKENFTPTGFLYEILPTIRDLLVENTGKAYYSELLKDIS